MKPLASAVVMLLIGAAPGVSAEECLYSNGTHILKIGPLEQQPCCNAVSLLDQATGSRYSGKLYLPNGRYAGTYPDELWIDLNRDGVEDFDPHGGEIFSWIEQSSGDAILRGLKSSVGAEETFRLSHCEKRSGFFDHKKLERSLSPVIDLIDLLFSPFRRSVPTL